MVRVETERARIRVFLNPGQDLSQERQKWTQIASFLEPDYKPLETLPCTEPQRSQGTCHPESSTFAFFAAGSTGAYFLHVRMHRSAYVAQHSNIVSVGGNEVRIHGNSFSAAHRSLQVNIHGTQCQRSSWKSDTAVICNSSPGALSSRSVVVSATEQTDTSHWIRKPYRVWPGF